MYLHLFGWVRNPPHSFKLSTNCGWKGSQCNPVDWRWFSNSTFFWAPHQNRHVEIETLLHPESRKLNEVEFPLFPYFGVETARSVFSPRISGDFVSHMLHPNGLDQNANLCYCTWSWSFFSMGPRWSSHLWSFPGCPSLHIHSLGWCSVRCPVLSSRSWWILLRDPNLS